MQAAVLGVRGNSGRLIALTQVGMECAIAVAASTRIPKSPAAPTGNGPIRNTDEVETVVGSDIY